MKPAFVTVQNLLYRTCCLQGLATGDSGFVAPGPYQSHCWAFPVRGTLVRSFRAQPPGWQLRVESCFPVPSLQSVSQDAGQCASLWNAQCGVQKVPPAAADVHPEQAIPRSPQPLRAVSDGAGGKAEVSKGSSEGSFVFLGVLSVPQGQRAISALRERWGWGGVDK